MEFKTDSQLFVHIYNKIMKNEFSEFDKVIDYIQSLKVNFNVDNIIKAVFDLYKKMNWGFFKDMDKYDFLKLWKEIVIINKKYNDCGDLKRNIEISNIYVAILDIHGYTKFCQGSKNNLSRLHSLDEFLQNGVKKIAKEEGTLAQRERGDEILLVGASATAVLNTVLGIINSFSKKRIFQDDAIARERSSHSINLPGFKISAGIGGGNYTNPLIITQEGILSGLLINIAARLQARANELSPAQSKILVTKSVQTNFMNENKVTKSQLYKMKVLSFFDHGPVEFKSLSVTCVEGVFREEDKYKIMFEEQLRTLFQSLNAQLWKQKVFTDLIDLIDQTCKVMPPFNVKMSIKGNEQAVTPALISVLCEKAKELYEKYEDYIEAVNMLGKITQRLEKIEDFDRLVLDYVRSVFSRYNEILDSFEKTLEQEISKNTHLIFNEKEKIAYNNITRNMELYDKLKSHARRSKALNKRKAIWNTFIENNLSNMKSRIQSQKNNGI
ncbi:MAG: hypothetical protein KKH98_03510 [Spirochaetes bacterium]|nr:hypothetical protein [Spirochaetota bacterium]